MSEIKLLKGVVSSVQSQISVSGDPTVVTHGTRIRTAHIKTFLVNDRPVIFQDNYQAAIKDGDKVVVAGIAKPSGLEAYAYKNFTNGTYSEGTGTIPLVLGKTAIFMALLIFLFNFHSDMVLALIPAVFIVPLGGLFIWMGRRFKKSTQLCMQEKEAD